eukprot:gb/GEZN01014286.1/.p1 GENE.gb/GEZN01014286.1/~~gb/GEZN01014286.1/.p1  ORF type:complete len:245 (-),score=24.31 gb/GEZN01014286.1/:147-881(-)
MTSKSLNSFELQRIVPGSMSSGEWIKQYEETERALRDAISTLRNKGPGRGKGRRLLMKSIEQADANIQTLESRIGSLEASRAIGAGEAQRRRQLISDLYALNANVKDILSGAKRRSNIQQEAMSRGDTEQTRGLSNAQLLETQQQEMSRQDTALDGILDGVSKLKVMSTDMGNELGLQESLLNDLQPMIENVDGRVVRNVNRIEDINENKGGWCPFVCTILLLALIVFLLTSNAACHIFNKDKC